MDAPKRIWAWITGIQPLQGNAGLWRSDEWTITDDEYILTAEHDRIVAEKRAEIVRLREAVDGAAFQITILANRLEAHGDDVASPAQEFSSRLRAAIRAMKGSGTDR